MLGVIGQMLGAPNQMLGATRANGIECLMNFKLRSKQLIALLLRTIVNKIFSLLTLGDLKKMSPLKKGSSKKAISKNIKTELKKHPQMKVAQAAAIAYSVAGKSKSKAKKKSK